MKIKEAGKKAKHKIIYMKDGSRRNIRNMGHKAKKTVRTINHKGKEKVKVIKVKIKAIKLADIFTLLNAAFGLLSILQSIQGNFLTASIFMLLGVLMDNIDGRVARMTGTASKMGIELDSLCDLVTFGMAPIVFVHQLSLADPSLQTPLLTFSLGVLLITGIIRLAKFNVQEIKTHFVGMPITTIGIIVPLCYYFSFPLGLYPYLFIVMGVFMITPLKVKKSFKN